MDTITRRLISGMLSTEIRRELIGPKVKLSGWTFSHSFHPPRAGQDHVHAFSGSREHPHIHVTGADGIFRKVTCSLPEVLHGASKPSSLHSVVMDRAYEGDETRQLVFDLHLQPVVPPKVNRLNPWQYDLELYKKRNEIERLFRRLKGFRRIFSRFEKLDVIFCAFIHIALIFDALIYVNTP